LDQRVFRSHYSDVAVLGKAVTRGPLWPAVGLTLHAMNGAVFGLAFHEVRRRVAGPPRVLAVGMALAEHVALYPLSYFIDRFHPARGEPGVPPLLKNPPAFAQATGGTRCSASCAVASPSREACCGKSDWEGACQ